MAQRKKGRKTGRNGTGKERSREEEWKRRDFVYDDSERSELLHTVTNKEARSSASVHRRTHLSSRDNSTGDSCGCPIKLIITKYYSLLMARYFTIYVGAADADAAMADSAPIKPSEASRRGVTTSDFHSAALSESSAGVIAWKSGEARLLSRGAAEAKRRESRIDRVTGRRRFYRDKESMGTRVEC